MERVWVIEEALHQHDIAAREEFEKSGNIEFTCTDEAPAKKEEEEEKGWGREGMLTTI